MKDLRIRRVLVSPELVVQFLQTGNRVEGLVVEEGLPAGATARAVTMDPVTGDFVLFVEHESFEPLPFEGAGVPLLTPRLRLVPR